MQFLLFWFMRPRFGVLSLACIIAALLIPPFFGVLLAASGILIETFCQNIFKQVLLSKQLLLSRLRKDHIDC